MSDSASPAVPVRRRSLRGLGPLSRDDLAANLGFADVAADEGVADIMRPGALRGAARGRNLDSVAYTLFLRIYPVIAVVVLMTQAAIAWVNYNDQYRLYTERAEVMVTLVAASIAQPGWNHDPARFRGALDALTRDPAFRYAALHDASGRTVVAAGQMPRTRPWELAHVSADLVPAGSAQAAGSLTVVLSTAALRASAEKQAMLSLGISLLLMLTFVVTLHATVRRHVIARLKRLLLAMREVEHKRWATVETDGEFRPRNEIDVITQAFNNMVEGLRSGDEAKQLLRDLEAAHAKLEQANRLVIESIGYARRIQSSVLPDHAALDRSGIEVAVLWEPLHLVGGDYFWLEEIDGLSFVVVADCTGHGVPGAFLTLIVATALDRLLHERGLRSPAAILAGLDTMVRAQLRQDGRGSESDDGLDCGICVWDRTARTLLFAGAGLSLTVIRDGVAERIRGEKRGLGYPRTGREVLPERDVDVPVAGATFYLMTDGITDQMGRPDPARPARLIGQKAVAERLAAHAALPLAQQVATLEAELAAYRGTEVRRDDMTLIAFRPR